MKTQISRWKKIARPAAGVIGLAAVIAWSGGGCREKHPGGETRPVEGPAVPDGVERTDVTVAVLPARIDVVGTVESEELVHLSARMPAYVDRVRVSAGDAVAKGDALIELDDREVREQLAAAEAQLKQAKTEYERAKGLLAEQATTDQAMTAAEAAYHAAQAQVDRVKVMMTYTRIVSPIDGIVTDRRIEAGDLANPGQVLLTVYDPTRMRVIAPTPLRLVEHLRPGESVEVTLERPEQTVTGEVSEVVSEIDPMTRTQTVKVRLPALDTPVLPGAFGRLWVEGEASPAVLAPASAVYRVGQLEYVQVDDNGRIARRLVRTGPVRGDRVEVLSGLREGDRVLAQPVLED